MLKMAKAVIKKLLLAGYACVSFVVAFSMASSNVAMAVDACSEPSGSLVITILTNSDTYVSIPYTRASLFCGTVQFASNNTITVQGAPGWTNGQWSQVTTNGYFPNYVVLTSGSKEGANYTITNNSPDTLFMVGDCDDLSGVTTGDQLAIIPFWTLGTIFPGGAGIIPSTSSLSRKTEILFPPPACAPHCSGVPHTGPIYFFFNNAWRKVGVNTASNFNDVVIFNDEYFIARQSSSAPTTMFTAAGNVVQYAQRTCLWADNFTTNWDNPVANYHSTTQTLDQVNLAAVITASNPGATNPVINDLLLVYNNAAMKKNKAPAHVYFYYIDHWADLNNPPYSVDRGGDPVFIPGTGVTVRRRPGSPSVWVIPP